MFTLLHRAGKTLTAHDVSKNGDNRRKHNTISVLSVTDAGHNSHYAVLRELTL